MVSNRCSRQCTRCLSCGLAVAQLYHKPNTAYTAAERGDIFLGSAYTVHAQRLTEPVYVTSWRNHLFIG